MGSKCSSRCCWTECTSKWTRWRRKLYQTECRKDSLQTRLWSTDGKLEIINGKRYYFLILFFCDVMLNDLGRKGFDFVFYCNLLFNLIMFLLQYQSVFLWLFAV